MDTRKYTCKRPIHPGELLKEEIEYRKLPQTKLAAQTGISYKILNEILNCRRPLTTSTAMLFEAVLGINAELLMRMQLDYNLQQAANDKSFMERRLSLSAFASNFLKKYNRYDSHIEGQGFVYDTWNKYPQMRFGISVSYRIGELRASVKKAVRTISNDDVKSGDSSSGGSGVGGGE